MQRTHKQTDESKKIRLIRKEAKLTQEQMGEVLNREQSTIQKYESGKLLIPSDVVTLLNEKFGMSFDWWYKTIGPKTAVPDKSNLIKDIAALTSLNKLLEIRVARLEDQIKKLVSDFYSSKYKV